MDLALFDFDGTITEKGAYPVFVRLCVRRGKKFVGSLVVVPMMVGYRWGVVSGPALRKATSRIAFWREEVTRIRALGEGFAAQGMPAMVRPLALERIAWHQARGDRVVVVSASLDVYLEPWCRALGLDLICSQLEAKDGRFTGRYLGGDCYGEEKARRIRERYDLARYAAIYAYGDTEEDREMLEMADRRFFRWEEETGERATAGGAARSV